MFVSFVFSLRRTGAKLLPCVVWFAMMLGTVFSASAQGCPELKATDFTTTLVAGNQDCHTGGTLWVSYRNNVAGFEKLVYDISKTGTDFDHAVETTDLSGTQKVPLPGWSAGDHVFLRVTAYCSGTPSRITIPLPDYSESPASSVKVKTQTTPAGGCLATSGSVAVNLNAVTGFAKAEYTLYRGASLVAREVSTTPYLPTTFFNLPSGDLRLVTRATPECVPSSPGSGWKDGAYELTQTVRVGSFSIVPSPIPTRGTCDGGLTVRSARVVGVTRINYEIFHRGGISGGQAPLQHHEADYPDFTHTFLSLPLGQYEIRATADCNVSETTEFEVVAGSAGTLAVNKLQNTYPHCSIGKIRAGVEGTTAACPVNYTLTPSDGRPSVVKNGVTSDAAIFDGLAAGTYTVKAVWGGQTQTKTVKIDVVSMGDLSLTAEKAEAICHPSGTITAKLEHGEYYGSNTLVLSIGGTAVRTVTLSEGQRTVEVHNLVPALYKVVLRNECGEEISSSVSIMYRQQMNATIGPITPKGGNQKDPCTGKLIIPFNDNNASPIQPNDVGSRTFLEGATYDIYQNGTLKESGAFAPWPSDGSAPSLNIQTALTGTIEIHVRPSCGSPEVIYQYFISADNYGGLQASVSKQSCTGGGAISVSEYGGFSGTVKKRYVAVRKKADRTLIGEVYLDKDNVRHQFTNLPAGEYLVEAAPDCNLGLIATTELTIKKSPYDPQINSDYVRFAPCVGYNNGELNITVYGYDVGDAVSPKPEIKGTLTNSSGDVIASHVISNYSNNTFYVRNLPAGTYKLTISNDNPACLGGDKVFTIVLPEGGAPDLQTGITISGQTATSFCPINGSCDLQLTNNGDPSKLLGLGSVVWKVYTLLYVNNNAVAGELLQTKTAATATEKVHFDNLPSRIYVTAEPSSCAGKILGTFFLQTNYNDNVIPEQMITVSPNAVLPGCGKGAITVTSKIKTLGYPSRPTKITLLTGDQENEWSDLINLREVASVSDPDIIETHTFSNLSAGAYVVRYEYCDQKINTRPVNVVNLFTPKLIVQNGQAGLCETYNPRPSIEPADASIRVKYVVLDRNSGLQIASVTAAGDKHADLSLEPGKYTITATITTSCSELVRTADIDVAEAKLYAYVQYTQNMTCANNGRVTAKVTNYGSLSKVTYHLQRVDNAQFWDAETTTPNVETTVMTGLLPGDYELTATGFCPPSIDGTVKQYSYKQKFKMSSNYQSLDVKQKPEMTRVSFACPAVGSVGVEFKNGYADGYKLFIKRSPSGVVSPEQEIQPIDNTKLTWGNNLAPGSYDLHATDGCEDIILPNVVVPEVQDVATAELAGCISRYSYKVNGVKKVSYSGNVRLNLSAFPDVNKRGRLQYGYEAAIVKRGATPTADDWYPKNTYRNWSDAQTCYNVSPYVTNCYAQLYCENINVDDNASSGVDVYLRRKGCPGTERHYEVPAQICYNGTLQLYYQNENCDQGYFNYNFDAEPKKSYDFVLKDDKTNTELCRQAVIYDQVNETFIAPTPTCGAPVTNPTFTSAGWYKYYVPRRTDGTYSAYIYDHGTNNLRYQAVSTLKTLQYSTSYYYNSNYAQEATTCDGMAYTFFTATNDNYCTRKDVKFYVYDNAGTKLDESPTYTSAWACTYQFKANTTYKYNCIDKDGVWKYPSPIPFTTPNFSVQDGYITPTISLADDCRETSVYIQNSYFTLNWPTGLNYRTYIKPTRIEIRRTDGGPTFYCKEPRIDSRIYSTIYYTLGNNFFYKRPDGTEVPLSYNDESKYRPGTYEVKIYDQCNGVKTYTYNVTRKNPVTVVWDEPEITVDCDNGITIKPKAHAYFQDRPSEPVTVVDFISNINDPLTGTNKRGTEFKTYNPTVSFGVNLKFANNTFCVPPTSKTYDLSYYLLSYDGSKSASFFCEANHRGQIRMALKGGKPPYTYKLKKLDGTLVDQQTVNGPCYFETGQQGERYIIDATDACGLKTIHQEVQLNDPRQLSYLMNKTLYFCDGEQATFSAIDFAGATYTWNLPDGTISHNKEITITTNSASAGDYKVHITPSSCTTTIDATVTVNVARVKESWKKQTKRVCSGQNATIEIGPATVFVNGVQNTTPTYQWQMTRDTTTAGSWEVVAGAVGENLTYAPPFTGAYYFRRITSQGSCRSTSYASTLQVDPGLSTNISPDELDVVINNKDPFTLTAGFLTGNPSRTYQWQRSLDRVHWTNVGTDVTFTETQRYASRQYYRRITTAGTCTTETPIITVRFKKRYPALINPQLRQRVKTD